MKKPATDTNNKQRFSALGKGTFPATAAFLLESPLRKLIKSPTTVADRLCLHQEQHVLELGAGGGYYSLEVAARLPKGHLILVDVQLNMLHRASQSIAGSGFLNTDSIVSDAAFLPIDSAQVDTVFMVTVLGEVFNKRKALNEAFRILRPGGLLSIGEQRTDPDFAALKTVKVLATQAGFVFDKQFGNRWNYTANFHKH